MRIISGKNKGRKIVAPASLPVRPTTDMAKESLFNILNNQIDIEDLDVLDIFAGTGNISYEFASRGSSTITSVDSNVACISFIRHIAEKLNYENLFAIQSDYKTFINHSIKKWDIIFADPPYDMANINTIPELIFENELLNKNGWLILEHSKNIDFSNQPNFKSHRVYGKVNFSFFSND